MTALELGWVPADACTLPTAAQSLRPAELDEVFAAALRAVERIAPDRLLLSFAPAAEAQLRELLVRETACCSFFAFQVTPADGELLVEVGVPLERIDVLDGLAVRAAEQRARCR
ncbi:hypothetical protein [Pseudonocardia xishanensis]|uniref:Uncharacterized protein n=1 Tax=Pseudonocardia xishanensis TaxID=630995 RepID=A0ABP8RL63_9PSEU